MKYKIIEQYRVSNYEEKPFTTGTSLNKK